MSDVDDDFMCEDEEDYGLVSFTGETRRFIDLIFVSAFSLFL
jgi:hypothetical protein